MKAIAIQPLSRNTMAAHMHRPVLGIEKRGGFRRFFP
jgi:hypothetical protein